MPGIQITGNGKPSSAAAGGSSFQESMIRNGNTPPAGGSSGDSLSGLNAAASFATGSLRRVGTAAYSASAALTAFEKKLAGFKFPSGAGGGGGFGRGNGGGAGAGSAGGSSSSPFFGAPGQYSEASWFNKKFNKDARAAQRTNAYSYAAYARNGAGHILDRAGRYSGMGEATSVAGYTLENPAMLPAVALGAYAFSPQIASLVSGAFGGATSSYRDTALSAYGAARAGGFNGQGVVDFFSNPTLNPALAARFKSVGLGPAAAMALQGQYGIGASSQSQLYNNVIGLQGMSMNGTLGDMDQSQLIAAQRTLSGGGLGSVSQNTTAFAALLADANAKGYDKSVMVNTMTASLTSLASAGGLGASAANTAAFVRSYADTGTMEGRNGTAAASMQAGLQSFAANPNASSFSSAVSNRLAGQFQTMADFKKKAPSIYALANDGNHPVLKQQIADYLAQPRTFQASGIGPILQNDPTLQSTLTNGVVYSLAGGGLPGALAVANLTGTNVGTVYTSNAANALANSGPLSKIKDPAQYAALMAAAKKYGVPPEILAGQYGYENSYGLNIVKNPKSSATGYFQFIDGTWKHYGKFNRKDFYQSVDAAAHYDSDLFNKYGVMNGLDHYGGPGYAKAIAGMGVDVSQAGPVSQGQAAINTRNSANDFTSFSAASATFAEFSPAVDKFAKAIDYFVNNMTNPNAPRYTTALDSDKYKVTAHGIQFTASKR